ncbi:DNA-3-methyladenine glycosylase family protein [Anaeromassilibacillus senegalensis]|uniref:DNA-3-methyladenine glycosylase family protein n=1 Tax=Anaeromassilibacillus senegalensis TaxID=1673717 RepID=UPI0006806484|nr:DNA glycosylase [Anaeromassilibacillus senegalensis]
MDLREFDLHATLECGQCFRWDRQPDGSFQGVAGGRVLRVSNDNLETALQDPFWRTYFDAARDYADIRQELSSLDAALARAAAYAPGIRILNQDPWEALCSFIISQNNNIPRIKGIISRLCASFGDPLEEGVFDFPTPERLAALDEEALAPLRCGFRARYILDAARKIASGAVDLEQARRIPVDEARASLMTIVGVGPKVADCALLYGLHRLDAFPMDVWMKRAMKELFPGKTPADFGPNAGIAQQYIFHFVRTSGPAAGKAGGPAVSKAGA